MLTAEPQCQAEPGVHPVVAVVDDDASFLRSVGRLVRSAGYRVALFGSAREFLASLPTVSPQCAVLDVHMPEMTGLELQDRLTTQGSRLPIVFVTAYDTPQAREHAQRSGSFGLFLKPFAQETFLQAIREAIGSQPKDADLDDPQDSGGDAGVGRGDFP